MDPETSTEPDYEECMSVNPGSARIPVPQDEWFQMKESIESLERKVVTLKSELAALRGEIHE